MADDQQKSYASYKKMAWIIYTLITIAVVVILVLFVAQDNEERFFFGLMPAAAAYVLRPTDKYMNKMILKYTGVSPPAEKE